MRSASAMKSSTGPSPSSPLNLGSLGGGIHGAWSRRLPPGASGAAIVARCCFLSGSCRATPSVRGREEWTPDSKQMVHHLLVVKTARGNEAILPHLWLKCSHGPRPKELLIQDGCHLLHSPLIYISWADHTDSTVQQNPCRLPEALQTTSVCFF